MNELTGDDQAIELLQQLGLKEYEAKSFVALSRVSAGTAKDISERSEVPRTRVYDAVRVLESKGLVEIHHSNPQQFRAVSVDEAADILRDEYHDRTESLRETLKALEPITTEPERDVTHEVWALSGNRTITARTEQLVSEADDEVVLILGDETMFTESLQDALEAAEQRGVTIIVGAAIEELRTTVQSALPDAEVFVSGLSWLASSDPDDQTDIERLLLVDRTTILISTSSGREDDEKAIFGRGFDNGLVTIVRRLMATGLLPVDDPGSERP
ncbi:MULTISPECIES: TrmB family transcriptional regulator [Haloarcula]|uniref:Transcription regulator TrmB N-terminal domain-containing protein n=1 Tax=Haloarcula pellucida TaxID=1427151 RepID=A0A830GN39_9EURY|nr:MULTISPECIES: TrmB family transcriptional regulator [Halomicroarcula]MBX0347893.1 TrmB family transcriptional regulator [Halomicroarcula pellucida]MDS0279978.1 TrmB family transcriptional regulator [Halomicroarcula sp. S1AR25-4]GGN95933.1 hypothetical protein GCM10009030_23620 [Halomicroarcula pellucida]